MFSLLLDKINYDVISSLLKFEVKVEQGVEQLEAQQRRAINAQAMEFQHAPVDALYGEVAQEQDNVIPLRSASASVRATPKVGRNDPCPCGSGKKFKQCHGKLD